MKLRAHKLGNAEGAEIAEAALVMPVVFIFLLGIIWFGRAFNIYSTITQAAQQGAIVAARPVCATCSSLPQGWPHDLSFQGDQAVVTAVTNVMQASSLDPNQILGGPGTLAPGCSVTSSIQICRELVVSNVVTGGPVATCTAPVQSQVCGVTVSFRFPVSLSVPFTSLATGSVTLSAQAQSRMEN
ncbi:MAG: TadE family protein [Terriglobales bacterium]